MKILKTFQFIREKLHIQPIDLNSVSLPTGEEDAAVIDDAIERYCVYDSWSAGTPVNPGELLEKYGKLCGYKIRPKTWDVNYDKEKNEITIEWVTQSNITNPSVGCLIADMFNALMTKIKTRSDAKIRLITGERGFFAAEDPEYEYYYDRKAKCFALVL